MCLWLRERRHWSACVCSSVCLLLWAIVRSYLSFPLIFPLHCETRFLRLPAGIALSGSDALLSRKMVLRKIEEEKRENSLWSWSTLRLGKALRETVSLTCAGVQRSAHGEKLQIGVLIQGVFDFSSGLARVGWGSFGQRGNKVYWAFQIGLE